MKFITILIALAALVAGVFAADESVGDRGACTSPNEGTTGCTNVFWYKRDSVVVCRDGKWQLVEKCARSGYCIPFPQAMCSGTYGHAARPPKIEREEDQEKEVGVEFVA